MVKLIWSPRSLKDLEIIFEYIKTDSIENARDFIEQLIEATTTITQFPTSGRVVPEVIDDNYREKLYKNYRIIYRHKAEVVEVITILHQSRRLHKSRLIK